MTKEETVKVTLVQGKCSYCDKIVVAPKEDFEKVWKVHIDSCEKYKEFEAKIRDMEAKGILKPYMRMVRVELLEKALKRLMKTYHSSPEELIKILEEAEQDDI